MTTCRWYCTVAEIVADLELPGVKDEAQLMRFVKAASRFFDQRGGHFIPITEQRRYDGDGQFDLWIDPLLAITAFALYDGDTAYTLTSADYLLNPPARWWANGPYTRLEIDLDGQVGAWFKGQQNAQITGRWGLYENTVATASEVLSDSDPTDLLLSSTGLLSPGMILKIDDEQIAVESTGSPTLNVANTAEAIDLSEEEIDLDDASDIQIGEVLRIDFEQFKVLDKVSNTCLVSRGYNGSKRTTHTANTDVYVYRSFGVSRGVNGTTAATHTAGTDVYRYVAPDDVNYLCRQIAVLMYRKAQSGFAGKVGNADTGETFYNNEFPNDPIGKIMRGYLGQIIR